MCANGPLTASQIYEQVTGGPGPAKLIDAQTACAQLQMRLHDRSKQVQDLGGTIAEGWQGNAGAAAAGAATPLATAAQHDADLLVTADRAIADQTNAFEVVKSKVVPVPPNPPPITSEDVKAGLLIPDMSGYFQKLGQWNAQSQANVDAFAAYHGASTSNGQTMPTVYAPLVDPGGSISMAEKPGGTDGFKGGSSEPPPGGPGGGVHSGPSAPPPSVPGGSGPQPHSGPPPASGPVPNGVSDNTRAASNIPGTDQPGNQQQVRPTPPGTPNLPNNPNYPGMVPGPPGYRGPGAPGGLRPGGFGPGTGGPGGLASGRVGGPGAVPGGPGVGGRMTGVGGPEGVAGRPGAAGAGGAGGRSGAMPMGGAPMAGRGEKEEDKEHQRAPYVKGEDPDELFGGDIVKPVPPTIGESKPHKP
ncbi:PPE domain-containing protein [Amycolatopsis suaedae]|uniref:PPE domain-containing protein n=1 Tax=Amycolatopsis suaedae TaxID=2510978 RepID=A0A4Q7JB06_9PSEU|nr:PPE domain-containing protein [Amycolatopsis suaedae]RZQ64248.1 PPE domain-containing protein [Amycolatopsis suaedae]